MPDLTVDQAFRLALQHHQAGRFAEAVPIYQQILAAQPNHADAIHLLGVIRLQSGDARQALEWIERALRLQPDVAVYHNNRGQALLRLNRIEESAAATRRALALDPNFDEAHNNLGTYFEGKGRLGAAAAEFETALRLKPESFQAHTNLGNVRKEQGELETAIAHYRRAIELQPRWSLLHSNLLLALHYYDRATAAEIAAAHRNWGRSFGAVASPRPAADAGDPARRLRIGYVSPDLREHAVARFIAPLLGQHDRARFDILCYSDSFHTDETSEKLKAHATLWRDVASLTDEQFVERVREDRVDILVDLAGHTSRTRLLAFAAKPAPVQITYLGYPNTTGLPAIDYRVVDPHSDPPGMTDAFCTEKLWRLPRTAWCYRPPDAAPLPKPSARLARGKVHFGSFNTLAKLSPRTIELWSGILRAAPNAKLVLKAKALSDEASQQAVVARFRQQGIDARRLVLLPWTRTTREHFAQYDEVDIALDSFPYHGTTTTCDALWMGVPVVTLAGDQHHSRVGKSLLHQVGLDDCVATSAAEYVRIATELARDPARVAELRAGLRARMAASPLRDEPALARDFEAMLQAMWRERFAPAAAATGKSA